MSGDRIFSCWMLIRPAEDLPDQWVAHCLEFDVVSQGTSPSHAFAMASEAASIVAADDLGRGRDPGERRAPKEFWAQLSQLMNHGSIVRVTDVEKFVRSVPNPRAMIFAAQAMVKATKAASHRKTLARSPYPYFAKERELMISCA